MRSFLLYAVLRLGLWALLWWVLILLDVGVMLAAVLAALIAMLISILFLDRLRDRAAMRWKGAHERRLERRGVKADEDAEFEDTLIDAEREPSGPRDAAASAEAQAAPVDPAALPELPGQDTGEGTAQDGEATDRSAGDTGPDPADTDAPGIAPEGPVRGSDR